MKRLIKTICLLLGVLLLLESSALSTCAVIRPMGKDHPGRGSGETAAVQEETAPQQLAAPAETSAPAADETVSDATEATEAETVPEEPARTTKVPESFYEVPEYFQTDYPDALFGKGTIATSGCSITSLAMVATYLTEHVYMPDELAGYFGGYIGNNMQRLEYAAEQLQLPWTKAKDFHDALAALEAGKVVIALMGENSLFTDMQHYIVLAGMTVDGKIIVNDPYAPNYEHWQLAAGFEEGFDENQVCWGFSGGWIFDKSAMPEEPFIYEQEEVVRGECRYPEIELTEAEKVMFAKLLWLECRGEPFEGQQAVAEVILNRMAASNFPSTLRSIIYAEGQFPSIVKMDEAQTTQTQFEAIEAAMYGPYILPKEVVFYATYKENDNFWGKIGQHYFCYQYDWKPEAEETVTESKTEEKKQTVKPPAFFFFRQQKYLTDGQNFANIAS